VTDRTLSAAERKEHADRIREEGFTILPGVVAPPLLEALDAALARLEERLQVVPAKNRFEGRNTLRVYNLLAHGELFERVPVHPAVLPLVEMVLDEGCLVSSLSSIAILPGEREQPLHADDQLIPLTRPHQAIVCNTMWAITDFTAANGATRVVPGSHRRDSVPTWGEDIETVPAEMERGSVLVYHGSLWHGGGANHTDARRVGVAMNYCAGFIRQQENQQLGIPLATIRRFSPRLRELVGLGVYNGVVGHIERRHPSCVLDDPDD
jgi:ectoine hydroxylase-related dioxygenase (phytanoyl-CoA dioxygenase family)